MGMANALLCPVVRGDNDAYEFGIHLVPLVRFLALSMHVVAMRLGRCHLSPRKALRRTTTVRLKLIILGVRISCAKQVVDGEWRG